MKTNQEIIEELENLLGERHHEVCIGKRCQCRLELKQLFRRALKAKDEQARQEKIELVESVTIDPNNNEMQIEDYLRGFKHGRFDKQDEIIKWKTNQLNKLKND